MVTVKTPTISDRFIKTICTRLAENKQVRRSLPVWGRVHIDRQLPFICIYRRKKDDDISLSERLIMGEASYLIATAQRRQHKQLALLIKNIAQTLKQSFGSFLMVEIWVSTDDDKERSPYKPVFKIIKPQKTAITSTIETLDRALKEIKIYKESVEVEVTTEAKISPAGMTPLLSVSEARQLGCHILGVEVRPIYKNSTTGQIFPMIRRELQRGFARALKNSFFNYTHDHTPYRPLHYQSLGRQSMVKAVWEVDRQLAEICNGFDFLLQVSPTNSNEAWSDFERNHYERKPEFVYRPLPIDPALAKRRLFLVPIERIEDPALAQLFREQQLELDRKFTMLIDRGTSRFMYGSLQLYGTIEESLQKIALELLEQLSPRSRDESSTNSVNAKTFAARALQEFAFFRKTYPEMRSKVMVRNDITGLMVSQGNLLIGAQTIIPQKRVEALIQHEVGTHVLTYLNGQAQPLKQLYIGLAGYEELQEGLAVLSEYLVGGLTRPRLRLLAARVVAAHDMINGASFVDVFRKLNKVYGFERRTAFTVTLRIFRSGGLTKDAVYLRGLVEVLEYFKNGGSIEPLFIGKISAEHIAIIKELQWRKVLRPAVLQPRYMDDPKTADKLNALRNGISLLNLIKRS